MSAAEHTHLPLHTSRRRRIAAAAGRVLAPAGSREPVRIRQGRAVSAAALLFALAATSGAAGSVMGVADLAHTGSVARAQYRTVSPSLTPPPTRTTSSPSRQPTPLQVLGNNNKKPSSTTTPTQAPSIVVRPTKGGEVELPFTGMLVVPLLLCGLLSLLLGVALRRRKLLN